MTTMNDTMPGIWSAPIQQRLYRGLLQAMARPGTIFDASNDLDGADVVDALIATVCDEAVTLADPQQLLKPQTLSLTGAKVVAPGEADWLVVDGSRPPHSQWTPRLGSISAPELSATIIVRVNFIGDDGENPGAVSSWSGPGIADCNHVTMSGLDPAWLNFRAQACARPPMGFDCFICAGQRYLGLPRTTRITTHSAGA